jgi:hypothetical protein
MMPEGRHGEGHSISEIFGVRDGRPVEHFWRIEFNPRRMAEFRRSWYGREMVADAL